MSIIRVVDLETTGFPPDAEVIEIATVDVVARPYHAPRIVDESCFALVKPGRAIPPESSAVHHLVDDDLIDCASWDETWPLFVCDAPPIWAAHSAKFERHFISDEMTVGASWICTWKCALRLWPEAPSHSNQALRYWLRPPQMDRRRAQLAHRALPDAYVTAHLLAMMIERSSVEQLVAWTGEPAVLARIPFGNMRGRPWGEADTSFLHWVLARDFDDDVMHTARSELERRRKADPPDDVDELDDEDETPPCQVPVTAGEVAG